SGHAPRPPLRAEPLRRRPGSTRWRWEPCVPAGQPSLSAAIRPYLRLRQVWKGRYRARKAAPGGGRGRRPRGARSRITMATRCSATEARGAGGGGGGGGGERERESERLCMQNHGSSTGSVTLATAVSNKHSLSNTCCAPRRGGSRQDLVLGQAALPHRPRFIEDRDFEVLARTLNERQSSLAGKGCISQGGRTKAGKTSVIWRAL
ncbi:unnamed protein product, partial [Prorocentrum cordatum]